MEQFKEEVIAALKKATKLKEITLTIPPEALMGDYAFPCFVLAKKLKKNPQEIAESLKNKIDIKGLIKDVMVVGPYLNFFMDEKKASEIILKNAFKDDYGKGKSGKKALVEHTSINPNASPHVGRARNALIGDCITRCLRFKGYKTEVHYFVNDVGKQIAMLVLGCGNKKVDFDGLLKVYIKINKEVEASKKKEEQVFELLKKLENGDKKTRADFKRVVDVCIKGQGKIMKELGIEYDFYDYESEYLFKKETSEILKKLEKTGKLFKDDEGRLVLSQKEFKLAMKSPVLVLTRADGTSLYPLRDIAYTIEKMSKGENNFVILGEDHKLYFEQLKAALSLLKHNAPKAVFYSFVLLSDGKMSTRKGNVVLLEEFMKEAVEKAEAELKKRKDKSKELAKIIGYGALKYSILKVSPEKNVTFDWDSALSFEGESAPYIQYAYARICSILKKNKHKVNDKAYFQLLKEKEEIEIIKKIGEFPDVVDEVIYSLRPSIIAGYAYALAKMLNEYYHKYPVLQEKEEIKKARLLMIYCVKNVLEKSLGLLGIEAPERM